MKTNKLKSILVILQLAPALLFAQSGADMFRQNCGACHTVGKGKLVGPDLRGVEQRHPSAWLYKWIKSSQSLVTSGDKAAVKLLADNSQIPMPDQALTNDQIKTILAYIKGEEGASNTVMASDPPVVPADNASIEADKTRAKLNTGFTPLVSSGTPATFEQAAPQDNNDVWQANKWFVYITIAVVLIIVTTSVALSSVVGEFEEPQAKGHKV